MAKAKLPIDVAGRRHMQNQDGKPVTSKSSEAEERLKAAKAAKLRAAKAAQAKKGSKSSNGVPNAKSGASGPRKSVGRGSGTKPLMHGAEAVAALIVAEHKTSRFKTKLILGLLAALALSLAWNSVQIWTKPEPKLLGMTTDGRIQPLPLLDEPLSNRQVLVDWVKRHIPEMYRFNFANYHGELNELLEFMRPVTLTSFRKQLEQSGILDRVKDDFLILEGRVTDEPLLQRNFVVQGTRVWVVEVPMVLIYESGEKINGQRERITQEIIFRAFVARANPIEFPGGLVLAKFEVSNRGRN